MIGTWGTNIVFEVSADYVKTFNNFKRDIEAKTTEHSLVNVPDKVQFLGRGLYKISFDMSFRIEMGLNPQKAIDQLHDALINGEVHPLRIGNKTFGNFIIKSLSDSYDLIDGRGNVFGAFVNVNMQEYV